MVAEHGDGIIGANLGTAATIGTFSFIHLWYQKGYGFAPGNFRFQKHVVIRLLNITVKELHFIILFQRKSEAGGHECLTRSAFTTGN